MNIIGRKDEQAQLRICEESRFPEFLVVYGRRRVGKTFLVREYFGDRFFFHHTGLANADKKAQLEEFHATLLRYGSTDLNTPKDWPTAFRQLRSLVEASDSHEKKVIFLDEMPWMDTRKSGFITALESFWNGWASGREDMLFIACGSATSWVTKKLFRNRGGLHNRVTKRMYLKPFELKDCKSYLDYLGMNYDIKRVSEAYMVFGGIPFYLSLLDKSMSLAQNIDCLCFSANGALVDEYQELYHSLFYKPERYMEVIEALSKRKSGLTRKEIIAHTKHTDGGALTKILDELEQCDFIKKFNSFEKKRDSLYRLVDPFTLFYFSFMKAKPTDENYWVNGLLGNDRNVWKGLAFEQVCFAHIRQIRQKLGIAGVGVSISSWRSTKTDPGAQIDLVIARKDNVVNLCEIKFYEGIYTLTKKSVSDLRRKRVAFMEETGTRATLHATVITVYGIAHNQYWQDIQSEVVLEDLFM